MLFKMAAFCYGIIGANLGIFLRQGTANGLKTNNGNFAC